MNSPASIPVSHIRERLLFDEERGVLLWRERFATSYRHETWNKRFAGRHVGCVNREGYIHFLMRHDGRDFTVQAHRAIWAMANGDWPSSMIDHIDGDRANNVLSNLRLATNSQNAANQKFFRSTRSGMKGIVKNANSYTARIIVNRESICLGTFPTAEQAVAAYETAAIAHFGQYARGAW